MQQTNFPIERLLALASVFFNTKTGHYITWEHVEEDHYTEESWDFYEDGIYLFSLAKGDQVISTLVNNEFILLETEDEMWTVRPFFEVDVAAFLHAYGTTEYSEESYLTSVTNIHEDIQGVVNAASIF